MSRQGWRNEPVRHGLAAKGIKTGTVKDLLKARKPGEFESSTYKQMIRENQRKEAAAEVEALVDQLGVDEKELRKRNVGLLDDLAAHTRAFHQGKEKSAGQEIDLITAELAKNETEFRQKRQVLLKDLAHWMGRYQKYV
jgi:hypothetical protein